MGEGVLEGVFGIGKDAHFIKELRRLETTQPVTEHLLALVRDRPEERKREVLADDRSNLEEPFLLGWETIDARGQNGLHCAGHVDRRQATRQLVGASWARQCARLDQRTDTLLDKERIALGALDQEALERVQAWVVPEEHIEQRFGTVPWQRVDPDLRVGGLAAPGMRILGPMADEQQETRTGEALDQALEERLRLAVDPLQIFEHQRQRLRLALTQQETLDGLQGPPPPP